MNDPKAAAAYHLGDAPVPRPDLDALIAEARRDAEGKGGARASLIRRLTDALAAERARADQAEQRIADANMAIMTWNINGARLSDLSRILTAEHP